ARPVARARADLDREPARPRARTAQLPAARRAARRQGRLRRAAGRARRPRLRRAVPPRHREARRPMTGLPLDWRSPGLRAGARRRIVLAILAAAAVSM